LGVNWKVSPKANFDKVGGLADLKLKGEILLASLSLKKIL